MNDGRDLREEIFELLNMLAEFYFPFLHVFAWPLWMDRDFFSIAYAERDLVFGMFVMWAHLCQVNLQLHIGEVSGLLSHLCLQIRKALSKSNLHQLPNITIVNFRNGL